MKNKPFSFRLPPATDRQVAETAMVMALAAMVCAWRLDWQGGYGLAAILLLSGMIARPLWVPVAKVWMGLGMAIARWASGILLTVLFFALVVPVGAIRRLLGKDSLRKSLKKGASGWISTDKTFTAEDFHHPF